MTELASLGVLQPLARRHLTCRRAPHRDSGALDGARAVVLERVDARRPREIGGEEWSARAYIDDQVLEPGMSVEVVKIEGATALVYE